MRAPASPAAVATHAEVAELLRDLMGRRCGEPGRDSEASVGDECAGDRQPIEEVVKAIANQHE